MFTSVNDFLNEWKQEVAVTQKVLDVLTDESLNQEVSPGLYSIGSLAWHITGATYYFPSQVGLKFEVPDLQKDAPKSATEISETYKTISQRLTQAFSKQVSEEKMNKMVNLFGMDMPFQAVFRLLIQHQAHHRGQLTVLMRQADLKVPGVYGPSKEEWEAMNAQKS
ncbi:DinB family protein [Lederbergia citrea]|uniref:DinB family protein n=1 Tax=Lederbergia citrea TaxID=2833581 RepID=UPI001BC9C177|nr:DinB family protein [Lederbergia citrea]MBS4176492.1 DinB family protein [Lederbergia citrea]MBS4203053.1 DinB family protein [Lederbergia citrea]